MQKTQNMDDAYDVLQESYQKLMLREKLQDMENPRAYLYRTATNIIIDRHRKGKHHTKYIREVVNNTDIGAASTASTIPPERQVAARQELAKIYLALDDLPEKCRQAFLMHREQHMKYGEIAQALEISVSMVEKHIIQALKHLRHRLK